MAAGCVLTLVDVTFGAGTVWLPLISLSLNSASVINQYNRYAAYFFEDLAALNVIPAKAYPRATEHVDGIVVMVQKLMEKGAAYTVR